MEAHQLLDKIISLKDLSFEETEWLMNEIMDGTLDPIFVSSILSTLRQKGESVEEITACTKVMRQKSIKINCQKNNLIDTAGTGDGSNTFNISTITAFVVAAAGYSVAKHGNRSSTSQSGSADLLEALGLTITLDAQSVASCIDHVGIGFLFAPVFHQAMKNVVPIRKMLKVRTIFNILGPLTNPANAQHQIIGVFSKKYVLPMINVLKNFQTKSAYVVAGHDGLDEVTNTDLTFIATLDKNNSITQFDFNPEEYNFKLRNKSDLIGGMAKENAEIAKSILAGNMQSSAKEDIIILNAGFALSTLEDASLTDCFEKAKNIIRQGLGLKKLNDLIDYTKSL